MGQKVNPISLRLGITRGWESNWYGGKNFADKLIEDEKIRKYIYARFARGGISKIVIERTIKRLIITVHTARPGIIIGKKGSEVDRLKEEIKKLTNIDVQINIFEIKRPELDAKLVAENIANQISGRMSYKRAVRGAIQNTMRLGADGIKVSVSGRLNGADIARSEHYKEGRTPLHTLRADIDYSLVEAQTTYGLIGVKVWICKGEVIGKRDISLNAEMNKGKSGKFSNAKARGNNNRRRRNNK